LKKVTQQPFMEMGYIIPSKKLQNEYISFVEQTNKLKLSIQNGLNQTETLKKTLMQQYFG
jgi:type I restriction enzyme S subunit